MRCGHALGPGRGVVRLFRSDLDQKGRRELSECSFALSDSHERQACLTNADEHLQASKHDLKQEKK